MLKLIISCLWVCVVTLSSAYAVIVMKTHQSEAVTPAKIDKVGYDKTRPVNIPMISNGAVQGYVIVQFNYSMKTDDVKKTSVPVEAFILDEAFKAIYADEKMDFKHLERYDVAALTKSIITKVNARLNAEVLKDVLVEEFNYISKEDISK